MKWIWTQRCRFVGGELDGGGDWAECRDLWASAGARNIVGFVQKKAKSPMATSLPSAKLRAQNVDDPGASVDQVDCLVRANIDIGTACLDG